MMKQTLFGLALAGAVAVTGLTGSAPTAQAGVKVYLGGPVLPRYNSYGHEYEHNYYGEYTPRCRWERRRVRYKKCWRKYNGRLKCRWKRRWRRVKVC